MPIELQAIADDDALVDGLASGAISTGDWLVQALAAWASFAQHGNGPQIADRPKEGSA